MGRADGRDMRDGGDSDSSFDSSLDPEEQERWEELQAEFLEYSNWRLLPGGCACKSDVVDSFRKHFSKYRNESDIATSEIEMVIQDWYHRKIRGNVVGCFYHGFHLNPKFLTEDHQVFRDLEGAGGGGSKEERKAQKKEAKKKAKKESRKGQVGTSEENHSKQEKKEKKKNKKTKQPQLQEANGNTNADAQAEEDQLNPEEWAHWRLDEEVGGTGKKERNSNKEKGDEGTKRKKKTKSRRNKE